MPQLVKGGKYIFGWTTIKNDLRLRIPDEAFDEYNLGKADKIILMSGSKASGGFGICTPDSLIKSKLGDHLTRLLGYQEKTDTFATNNMEIVKSGDRLIWWTYLDKEKYFYLSNELIKLFNLKPGNKLLVARGSGIGPGFIARGVIYNEALKHKNIFEY
jgi:hypothetical protein